MDINNVVPTRHTWKFMVIPIKQEQINKEVSFYLGVVSRLFNDRKLDEDIVNNNDETKFIVIMIKGKHWVLLGFKTLRIMTFYLV